MVLFPFYLFGPILKPFPFESTLTQVSSVFENLMMSIDILNLHNLYIYIKSKITFYIQELLESNYVTTANLFNNHNFLEYRLIFN